MFRSLIRKAGFLALAAAITFGMSAGYAPSGEQTVSAANPVAWQPGQLHIGSIDVGQGDATLIVSPEGKSLLVDVNQSSAAKIADYIQTVLGHKNLDYILVTHYHADHMGDYVNLLKNYGVTVKTATYDRGGDRYEYNSTLYQTYYDYVTNAANNAKRTRIYENDLINMGASMSVKVVSIGDLDSDTASGVTVINENDNSIALKVKYGELDYFVAGDLSGANYWNSAGGYGYADIETSVAPKVGSIEVYRVDHHGSSHSSNQFFVDTLKPSVSIISLGQNSYGHPAPEVVSRLTPYGKVYQTENSDGTIKDGDVILTSTDGVHYTVNGTTYTTKESGGGSTPGGGDTGGGTPGTVANILINEILPAPSKKYTKEFVELYNPGTTAVDLSGWKIDDIQNGGSAAYTIPAGTTIAAGGYYVYQPSSVFNNAGDDVVLLSPTGTVVDQKTYGSTGYDVSWYRVKATGQWSSTTTSNVTMGTVNP
ncbi:lamin tail domain-containing protein [Tumebacillus sp. DT12]|uniref:Lamin tail domain-containing protein n=1 Tax=Tumebacillus lacus TaxID=2995335 RepID=A0ABT3WZ67_9BACL|nr:lamin tail domain-containing protein [Tumebacillus lacus]MCX7569940.1 lamin tail domain-containing protein [Tumebacillus lacus]